MNSTSTTPAPVIVQHSPAVREQKRARHFFSDGRDLFQTKSPSMKLIGSTNAVSLHRQRVAIAQQQALIDEQDSSFISTLFHTGIPADAWTD